MTVARTPVSKDALPIQHRNPRGSVLSVAIASGALVIFTIIVIGFMVARIETFAQVQGAPPGFAAPIVLVCSLIALIPLGFVLWAVYAIDRWEPEPTWLLIASLIWGGAFAIFFTLEIGGLWGDGRILSFLGAFGIEPPKILPGWSDWLNNGGATVMAQTLQPMFPNITPESTYDFFSAVIQAPLVEELTKAVPIVVAFVLLRKHFDGPIDGVVIAALSAAGFAYTENIQYFSMNGGEIFATSSTFLIRGIMSPLAHALFSALGMGLALGIAARRPSRLWGLALFPVGYAVSVLLHAFWNSTDFWLPEGAGAFFGYYMLVQVPICLAAVLLIVMLRRFERRVTFLRLRDYGQAGWFTPSEVTMLATGDGRATLGRWAKVHGLGKAMKAYIASTTRLALNRQRVITGRDKLRPVADEAALLSDVSALREHMGFFAQGAPVHPQQGHAMPAVAGVASTSDRLGGGWQLPQQHYPPQAWPGTQQQQPFEQPRP